MSTVGQLMFLMDIGMDVYMNKELDKKAFFVNKWVNVVMKYETILEMKLNGRCWKACLVGRWFLEHLCSK
jgi:hypothetical protein